MLRCRCLNMLTVILVWLAFLPSGFGQRGCFNCESITYLDTDFTDKTELEDANCILGNFTDADALPCPLFAFCYTFDGIITWFVPGYGFVDAHLTKRGCVTGLSFSDTPGGCYSRHESFSYMYQLYNGRFTDRNMTNVDGNLCGCENSNCNNKEGALIEVERDGLVPDPNVRGLQCLYCFHQVTNHPALTHVNVENPSCSHGELQDVDVYYHTCGSGGVCGVIEGNVTLNGAVFSYFRRDCMYDIQNLHVTTKDDGFLCVDEEEEADEFVISHLFGDVSDIGSVTFNGQLCYCTSDLCELSTGVPRNPTSKPTPDNGSTSNAIPKTAVFIVCHVILTILVLGEV